MDLQNLQDLYDALEDKLYPSGAVLDDAEYDYNARINQLLEQLQSEINLEEQNYEYGEIEKKDSDLQELESLRDKKQQLQEQQKKIAEAEKLVDAMENQGPNLDE